MFGSDGEFLLLFLLIGSGEFLLLFLLIGSGELQHSSDFRDTFKNSFPALLSHVSFLAAFVSLPA